MGQEDPLEREMATHSSTLAWKIHGWRSLAGYSPWGLKESNTTEQPHLKDILINYCLKLDAKTVFK